MARPLSVSRAADREPMAKAIEAACHEAGATATRCPHLTKGRRIVLDIEGAERLSLYVDLDGDSSAVRSGTFLLSWHVRKPGVELAPGFPGGTVGDLNRSKATAVCQGFEAARSLIASTLLGARDGWFFVHTAEDAEGQRHAA